MNITRQDFGFRQSLIALAVLAACTQVYAQDSDAAQQSRPESSVSVGAGAISGNQRDRSLMGQYSGMRDNSGFIQLDVDINKRDDETGTSMTVKGRNLGLDNRDLSFTHEKQGDWKYGLDYSELVRRDPRTINTGMTGAGTTTPSIVRLATPGSGADLDFKLKRVGINLLGEKWINPNLQLEVNFKNEDKTGERRFGKGYACAAYVCNSTQTATNQTWALLLMAEPVNTATKQIDARLNWAADKLNLSAGYYGSFFTNANGNVTATVPNSLNNPLGAASTLSPAAAGTVIPGGGTSLQNVLQMPMALAPDNQAHQFYLSGNYASSPTTKATFKYAYTHATQDRDFAAMGLGNAPAGVTSLGGVLDTTVAQAGLTARPMPKLSMLANLRYENRDDKTPDALYNVEGGAVVPATVPATYVNRYWNNYHASSTRVAGKVEGTYQLQSDLRGTVGLDYSTHERPVPISLTEEELAGIGALRAKNQETGYRLELRRSVSETLTGAVGYSNSLRTGSDWTSLSTSTAFAAAGLGYGQTGSASQFIALSATNAFPMSLADVRREKVKLSANWNPNERLEMQFYVEDGTDRNVTAADAIAGGKGWRGNGTTTYSVDASYAVTDSWKLNGYASQGNQNLKVNHSTGYMADVNTRSDAFGIGVTAQPTGRLELGARVMYLNDDTRYGLAASPSATGAAPSAANLAQAAIGLPNVKYETTSVNLYAKYALDKNAAVRVSLVHQTIKLDEWSYGYNGVPFVYSDNTTVTMNQVQSVTAIGAAYIYKF